MSAKAAIPKANIGDVVAYLDREGRYHEQRLLKIEAHWDGYEDASADPYVIYTVRHPTYRNRQFYCSNVAKVTPALPPQESGE